MASTLLLSLLVFSLLPLSSPISDETIADAAEILSNSGFNAMSLTLPLVSKTLISTLPSATLFSPSDESFSLSFSGQPSLSLLQFHFTPRFYSFVDLQSLPFGSQIPTLLPNHSLSLTSSIFDDDISLNGVNINSSPLFDDGFLVIFKIDRFFDPDFRFGSSAPSQNPYLSPSPGIAQCPAYSDSGSGSYGEASAALRSSGYSIMAAFLELQLTQFDYGVTVFAPTDAAMEGYVGNYTDWGSVFLRHVVPCRLSWADLVGLDDGFVLSTFLGGFAIHVSHSTDTLMINGEVAIDFPDFYHSDRVLIHGVRGVLSVSKKSDEREIEGGRVEGGGGGAYSPGNQWMMYQESDVDHGEF